MKSFEAGASEYKPVKSIASYKKMKGKEWKSGVSKTGQEEEKKAQDVVINKGGKFLKKLWCCVGGSITR